MDSSSFPSKSTIEHVELSMKRSDKKEIRKLTWGFISSWELKVVHMRTKNHCQNKFSTTSLDLETNLPTSWVCNTSFICILSSLWWPSYLVGMIRLSKREAWDMYRDSWVLRFWQHWVGLMIMKRTPKHICPLKSIYLLFCFVFSITIRNRVTQDVQQHYTIHHRWRKKY